MKNVLYLILAFVIVFVLWKVVMHLIGMVLAPVIAIGMILLFCFLVYTVYKAMTREKIM